MILQYGNLTILSIEELNEMFPTTSQNEEKGIRVFAEEQWQEHNSSSRIFGIDIQAPDLYPILKFPEARKKYRKVNTLGRGKSSGNKSSESAHRNRVDIFVEEPDGTGVKVLDNHVANRMVSIDQIDSEFEKLKIRLDISRSNSSCVHVSGVDGVPNGRVSPGLARKGGGGGGGGGIRPVRSSDK